MQNNLYFSTCSNCGKYKIISSLLNLSNTAKWHTFQSANYDFNKWNAFGKERQGQYLSNYSSWKGKKKLEKKIRNHLQ